MIFKAVLSWTRHHSFFSELSVIKSVSLCCEVTRVLDHLDTKALQSLVFQMLDLVHSFLYLIESSCNIILARSRIQSWWFDSFLIHQLVVIRKQTFRLLLLSLFLYVLGRVFALSVHHLLKWLLSKFDIVRNRIFTYTDIFFLPLISVIW